MVAAMVSGRIFFTDSPCLFVTVSSISFTLAIDFVGSSLSLGYRNHILLPQSNFVLSLFNNIFAMQVIACYLILVGSHCIFAVMLLVNGFKIALYFGVWRMGVVAYSAILVSPLAGLKIRPWLILLGLILENHIINFTNMLSLQELFSRYCFRLHRSRLTC
jgi:hypothetical protein